LSYSANVVSNSNSITETATVADATATVTVNGVAVVSGSPSGPITLGNGSNVITTVVTAQNGVTTKTYTVDVNYAPLSSCTYSLSPLDLSNTAPAGGIANIIVTTPNGCPVTATSFQPWVSVNSITASGGTTTVQLQISANAGTPRAASIVVADRLFLITQNGP
jgi:beta-glucanase (GH16 family)